MNPNPHFICKRGHKRSDVGVLPNGTCCKCHNEQLKQYRRGNPTKVKIIKRRSYLKHRKEIIKRNILYRKNNRGKMAYKQRARIYKKSYGITIEQYEKAFRLQNGVCKLCFKAPTKKRLSVDHVHTKVEKEKRARGLLCWLCNRRLIGRNTAKQADLFRRAADYLESDFDIRLL